MGSPRLKRGAWECGRRVKRAALALSALPGRPGGVLNAPPTPQKCGRVGLGGSMLVLGHALFV